MTRRDVEQWAKGGEAGRVGELVGPLVEQLDRLREQRRDVEGWLAYVLRALAITPGRQCLDQLLRVYEGAGDGRLLASMIASEQSFEDALYVLAQEPRTARQDVLGGCLHHELLLRGADPDVLKRVSRRRMPYGLVWPHDLGWLPTELREVERELAFPGYDYDRGSDAGGAGELAAPVPVGPAARRAGAAYWLRPAASVDLTEALVGPPKLGRFLSFEGRMFTADRPLPHDAVPGVLAALPLECLEGLDDGTRFEVSAGSLAEVWRILYYSAASGGGGFSGVLGAYGRLAAWASVGALAGADLHASFADVEERAHACTWWRFATDAEWFHNDLGADYGVAALTPDGRRLTVLAATHTD